MGLLHSKEFFLNHIFQSQQIDDTKEWVTFQHSTQMTKGLVFHFVLTQLATTL